MTEIDLSEAKKITRTADSQSRIRLPASKYAKMGVTVVVAGKILIILND